MVSSRPFRAGGALGLFAMAVALCFLVAAGGATPARAEIKVGSDQGRVLVRFATVKCTVARRGGEPGFRAEAKKGSWLLRLNIYPGDFVGYREYPIHYGGDSPADISLWHGSGRPWSNSYRPEHVTTPEGTITLPPPGVVRFPARRGGHDLQIGLGPIWNGFESDDAVAITGRARCR
ncbi:MAG: hypothetical protein JST08_09110 [Actinobacteria bacterium]|nr:hypothetical protein [Actinomycetota bacterium]